jgi:hypothetical protein
MKHWKKLLTKVIVIALRGRHRVTLMKSIPNADKTPIWKLSFSIQTSEVSSTKCLWNVLPNKAHIRRKMDSEQVTLKFLSIFHHRVRSCIFYIISRQFIQMSSYFQQYRGAMRYIFQGKNKLSRKRNWWEKFKKVWTKRHRVTFVKADTLNLYPCLLFFTNIVGSFKNHRFELVSHFFITFYWFFYKIDVIYPENVNYYFKK